MSEAAASVLPIQIPVISTRRLVLRPFTFEDRDAYLGILNGDGVRRYFPSSEPYSKRRVEMAFTANTKHWYRHGFGLWALVHLESGELIGRVGLQYLEDTDEVEVDYMLAPPHWGRGYATEAGTASVHFGFWNAGLAQIIGISHKDNIASQRVLSKIGLKRRGEEEYFGMECVVYSMKRPHFLVSLKP